MDFAQECGERSRLIDIAKSWIRTPYHAREMRKGMGCDCAGLPAGVAIEAGFIEPFQLPFYDEQQWLRKNYEDKQFLEVMLKYANEITDGCVLPGDFVLYRVAWSFTHGAIIVRWPDFVLHCVKAMGVVGSHGLNEGFLHRKKMRFFRLKRWC